MKTLKKITLHLLISVGFFLPVVTLAAPTKPPVLKICVSPEGIFKAKKRCRKGFETEFSSSSFANFVPTIQGPIGEPGPAGPIGPSEIISKGGVNSITDFGTTPKTILSITSVDALNPNANYMVFAKLRLNGVLTATTPNTVTCVLTRTPSLTPDLDFSWVEMGAAAGKVELATLTLQAPLPPLAGSNGVALRCSAESQGASESVRASAYELTVIETENLILP